MFASCVSPNICSSYHVVSLGMFRCLSPVSTNKQTQGKLFKYIRQPKRIYTREADVCLNIELATQLLYCRLVLLHCRQAIHSLLNSFPAVTSITTSSLVFTLQVRQRWIEFRSSGNTRMESWKFQYFPFPGISAASVSAVSRSPENVKNLILSPPRHSFLYTIDTGRHQRTFIIQSHQTEMGLLLLNSPRIVCTCASLLAAAEVDSWTSMYCRYLQNNLIFLTYSSIMALSMTEGMGKDPIKETFPTPNTII